MATEKRLIDANEISYHQSGFPKGDGFDSGLDWVFREDIKRLPTVDAVEVVQCADCWNCEEIDNCLYCTHWEKNTYAGDFCCHGERRNNA